MPIFLIVYTYAFIMNNKWCLSFCVKGKHTFFEWLGRVFFEVRMKAGVRWKSIRFVAGPHK